MHNKKNLLYVHVLYIYFLNTLEEDQDTIW